MRAEKGQPVQFPGPRRMPPKKIARNIIEFLIGDFVLALLITAAIGAARFIHLLDGGALGLLELGWTFLVFFLIIPVVYWWSTRKARR